MKEGIETLVLKDFEEELGDVNDDDVTVTLDPIEVARIREAFIHHLDQRVKRTIELREEQLRLVQQQEVNDKAIEVSEFFLRKDRERLLTLFHKIAGGQSVNNEVEKKGPACDECGEPLSGVHFLAEDDSGDKLCSPCYQEMKENPGKCSFRCRECGALENITKRPIIKDEHGNRICFSCSLKKARKVQDENLEKTSCSYCKADDVFVLKTAFGMMCRHCFVDARKGNVSFIKKFKKEASKEEKHNCFYCEKELKEEDESIFIGNGNFQCKDCLEKNQKHLELINNTKPVEKPESNEVVVSDRDNPAPLGVLEFDEHMEEYCTHCFSCGMRSKVFKVESEADAINGLIQNGFKQHMLGGEHRWFCVGCSLEQRKVEEKNGFTVG